MLLCSQCHVLLLLYCSIIRLEFNHEHLDYYTEIDAVELSGNIVLAEDEPLQQCHDTEDIDTKVTTRLMKQLSINEEVETSELCSDNGFFDLLPVSTPFQTVQIIMFRCILCDFFYCFAFNCFYCTAFPE